ncbi:uncharacterized protein EDB91DRAFT_1152702 [Suillus paluster]|uniref:uncharacterized protein n=1 Tax=Suillus paluster TaxID=48578 RepID=UPI001B86EC9E|nr:uncharacterized protein EDB91DRAFT_1152702 [Suillus paluster]KAG1731981.1 hypothetical protein EDB91DRAFT_1152702 [Suillus paluster]
MSISLLQNATVVEQALTLCTRLDHLGAPRFAHRRLQLPCIVFPITEVRRSRGQDQKTRFTYYVKANGLKDLVITTEARLGQFSQARPGQQTFMLVRPWNIHDLGLPNFVGDRTIKTLSMPWSMSDHSLYGSPKAYAPADLESHARASRLIARLGQPFGALLLAQQRVGEYRRIASDNNIIAQVKDVTSVRDMMDVRTLEIL